MPFIRTATTSTRSAWRPTIPNSLERPAARSASSSSRSALAAHLAPLEKKWFVYAKSPFAGPRPWQTGQAIRGDSLWRCRSRSAVAGGAALPRRAVNCSPAQIACAAAASRDDGRLRHPRSGHCARARRLEADLAQALRYRARHGCHQGPTQRSLTLKASAFTRSDL